MGNQKKIVKTPPDKAKSAVKGAKVVKNGAKDSKMVKKVAKVLAKVTGKNRGPSAGGSSGVNSANANSANRVSGAGGKAKKTKKSQDETTGKATPTKKNAPASGGKSPPAKSSASKINAVKSAKKSPTTTVSQKKKTSPVKTTSGALKRTSVKSSPVGKKSTPAKSPKSKTPMTTKGRAGANAGKSSSVKKSQGGKGPKRVASKSAASSPSKGDESSEDESEASESESENETPKRGAKSPGPKKRTKSVTPKKKTPTKKPPSKKTPQGSKAAKDGDESDEGESTSDDESPDDDGSRKSKARIKLSSTGGRGNPKNKASSSPGKAGSKLKVPSSKRSRKPTEGESDTLDEEEDDQDEGEKDTLRKKTPTQASSKKAQVPNRGRAAVEKKAGQAPTKVKKKPGTMSKKVPSTPKVADDSSSDDDKSSLDSNEEDSSPAQSGKAAKKLPPTQKGRANQGTKPQKGKAAETKKTTKESSSSDDDHSDSSSEDEGDRPKKGAKGGKRVVPKKKAPAAKKKDSKVMMAKKKLKQMQSLGFWGAPPRRAASLNATAVMHFMYDQDIVSSKVTNSSAITSPNTPKAIEKDSKEPPKASKPQPRRSAAAKMKEEEEELEEGGEKAEASEGQKSGSKKAKTSGKKVKKEDSDSEEVSEEESETDDEKSKPIAKGKPNKIPQKKPVKKSSSSVAAASRSKKKIVPKGKGTAKPEKDTSEEDASEASSSTDESSEEADEAPIPIKRKQLEKKKKKTLKDEFKMDIKDMIVKKRIASLNASAIMTASYAQFKSPPMSPVKAIESKVEEPKPITALVPASQGKKKMAQKQEEKAKKTKKASMATASAALSPPPLKMKKTLSQEEEQPIIFEIEDERIKSLLIASAMKKAGNNSAMLHKDERAQKLPPKKRKLDKTAAAALPISGPGHKKKHHHNMGGGSSSYRHDDGPKRKKKKKGKMKKINVDMTSSSESVSSSSSEESDDGSRRRSTRADRDLDDDEEEIETIFTEGARNEGIVSCLPSSSSQGGTVLSTPDNPMALKTEMNKVDVQILDSGRVIHHHQVVHHRYETISTTTSMVPRSGSGGESSNQQDEAVSASGKYTPLSALASLQPGNSHALPTQPQGGVNPAPPTVHPPSASRFPSTFPGFYQPAGPLIRPGSPPSNVPPTATVQPTVVSSGSGLGSGSGRSSGGSHGNSSLRDSEFSPSQKATPSTSPVKPTPQTATAHHVPVVHPPTLQAPYPHAYPYPYPPEYLTPHGYVPAPPPPQLSYPPGAAHLPGAPPSAPQTLAYPQYHPAEYRHPYPLYPTAQGYPPQGSYYLAPALPYHPPSITSVNSPSTSSTQVAIPAPHPAAAAFYYGGYSAAAYPYTAAGRIVTPVLALAPPGQAHPMAPPGFPTQHHQAQTSIYSYSVQHDPKNVQAGSQPVGKGLSSQAPPPPTHATTPTTATTTVVSAGINTKSVSSTNSKKAPKSVSSKEVRPTLKVPTPKSSLAMAAAAHNSEAIRQILPRQPLPPKASSGYTKARSQGTKAMPKIAIVPSSHVQPFVVGQTTIHPVDPNALRKPPATVVESQMATITPKMVPVVSASLSSKASTPASKSSLRDYRKPAKAKSQSSTAKVTPQSPITSITPVGGGSFQKGSTGTFSSLRSPPALPLQPGKGGMHPIVRPPTSVAPPLYQHLPKGLTITEIDRSRSLATKGFGGYKGGSKITTVPSNSQTVVATSKPSSLFPLNPTSNNGHRLQLMPVISIPHPNNRGKVGPPIPMGHPGLPNGLLRMAHTSLPQAQSQPPPPKIATKVVPKDLKSQLALTKIGLSMAQSSCGVDSAQSTYTIANLSKNGIVPPPPSISVSMAQTAARALHKPSKMMTKKPKTSTLLKTPRANNNKPSLLSSGRPTSSLKSLGKSTGSPGSSRSSSRNSSLSPRERAASGSNSSIKGGSASSNNSSCSTSGGAGGRPGKVNFSPFAKNSAPGMGKKRNNNGASLQQIPEGPLIPWSKRHSGVVKSCNGWQWMGDGTEQKVYLNNEDPPVARICYNSMKHFTEGDVVKIRDCILLASGNRKKDLPFIAKVTALWENPSDGEMMMSLLWYYRPEHLDNGRRSDDMSDEVYASRHRDSTSVACIEDKCYVMTYNEYCRYRKFLRMVEASGPSPSSIVPDPPKGYDRAEFLPTQRVAPDRVFLCRRVYESRQRRLLKNPY